MNTRMKVARLVAVPLAVCSAGLGLALSPASGQGGDLSMLDRLEPGLWELRAREPGIPAKRLCIGNGRDFVQLRHSGLDCERVVVSDTPAHVSVQYTCRGQGYGRTSVRRETDSLVQLDSQGIEQGRPFAFAAEARRLGACRGG